MSKSYGVLKAMKELRFKEEDKRETVADFELIKNLPGHVEVFVALDPKAEKIWEIYQKEVIGAPCCQSRWEAFYRIKRDFSRYILSIPAKLLVDKVDTSKPLPYIPPCLASEFYDPETGFKRVEEGVTIV
ncbi:MAG: hypothetical protein ACUVTO_05775 [Candidatus Caldatribacteriaceae bacterium]